MTLVREADRRRRFGKPDSTVDELHRAKHAMGAQIVARRHAPVGAKRLREVHGVRANDAPELAQRWRPGHVRHEELAGLFEPGWRTGSGHFSERAQNRVGRIAYEAGPARAGLAERPHQEPPELEGGSETEAGRVNRGARPSVVGVQLDEQQASALRVVLGFVRAKRATRKEGEWRVALELEPGPFTAPACQQDADFRRVVCVRRQDERGRVMHLDEAHPVDSHLVVDDSVAPDKVHRAGPLFW
nr:hypothetical protein [Pyxidicoccus parkwaysis]